LSGLCKRPPPGGGRVAGGGYGGRREESWSPWERRGGSGPRAGEGWRWLEPGACREVWTTGGEGSASWDRMDREECCRVACRECCGEDSGPEGERAGDPGGEYAGGESGIGGDGWRVAWEGDGREG
jgi:hypothetical protein